MDDSLIPDSAVQRRRRIHPLLWIGGGIGIVLLLILAMFTLMLRQMSAVPDDLDYADTQTSEGGLYQVSYTGSLDPVPINKMHTWTLHVETADGQPINDATITVNGDMPQHGHGMPTQPQVTQSLGNGDYLVEGMKFQMGGWWVIDFIITANGQTDKVSFNLKLQG